MSKDIINMKNNKIFKLNCPKCGTERVYTSYAALYTAKKNGTLCKKCAQRKIVKHTSAVEKLLEESPESYYWMGFLLADGNFKDGRIRLGLGIKDENHLLRFCKYINYFGSISKTAIKVSMGVMHKEVVEQIQEKFNIQENKTLNPPKYIIPNNFLGLSLIIGFIDGDGNINKQYKRQDGLIRIKCHSSWFSILCQFSAILNCAQPYINKQGYVVLNIAKRSSIELLQSNIRQYTLPVLIRKWNKLC